MPLGQASCAVTAEPRDLLIPLEDVKAVACASTPSAPAKGRKQLQPTEMGPNFSVGVGGGTGWACAEPQHGRDPEDARSPTRASSWHFMGLGPLCVGPRLCDKAPGPPAPRRVPRASDRRREGRRVEGARATAVPHITASCCPPPPHSPRGVQWVGASSGVASMVQTGLERVPFPDRPLG